MPGIMINGVNVPVSGTDSYLAIQSQLFWDWVNKVDKGLIVTDIQFQSVDLYKEPKASGPALFIKFKATVINKKGRPLPGIVVLRGGSVAVLVVLNCNGEKFAVLVSQARVPTGKSSFLEIPAGMLDGEGNVSLVAVKELWQELGIKIYENDLCSLWHTNLYTSPGLLDEVCKLYCIDIDVDKAFMRTLDDRLRSCEGEHEHITTKVIALNMLPLLTSDMKTLLAYHLYRALP